VPAVQKEQTFQPQDVAATPRVSVVVPCHNERGNLRQLVTEIRQALQSSESPYEILLVDDASTDGTWELLQKLGAEDLRVRAMRFGNQCGQSAAMWAGMQNAIGDIIVTLDADLQNPPAEIPRLLDALEGWDCVCGSRLTARMDGDNWVRRASSKIANGVRTTFIKDGMSDSGCCFRAFRRECVQHLIFFEGAHRFFPALLMMERFRVTEIPISHRPRGTGQTHYGLWNRLIKSLPDLFAMSWLQSRLIRYQTADTINPPEEKRP
jgi:glycosyltransferase involved in cell wall biosynthesis